MCVMSDALCVMCDQCDSQMSLPCVLSCVMSDEGLFRRILKRLAWQHIQNREKGLLEDIIEFQEQLAQVKHRIAFP